MAILYLILLFLTDWNGRVALYGALSFALVGAVGRVFMPANEGRRPPDR